MAEEVQAQAVPTSGSVQPAGAPLRDFTVDVSAVSTAYANFARVTGTPEELVLDFGLNTQLTPNPAEPVKVSHRLVVNYYTAKRMLHALHVALQRHESVYGALETDIQKRIRAAPKPRPGSASN